MRWRYSLIGGPSSDGGSNGKHRSLAVICSATVATSLLITSAVYALNGWPFNQRTPLNCAIRVAQAALLGHSPRPVTTFPSAPRASELMPRDLLNGKDRPEDLKAPSRLIHQSWKNRSPPHRFLAWADSWRRHHPDWSYVLWTDEDNLELVRQYYPEYLETYLALPSEIYRADMVRNCYMHHFGGIYADLDVEALRSLEPLLDSLEVSSGRSIAYTARMHTTNDVGALMNSIPNAFMAASEAGHPFWLQPLNYVVQHIDEHADQPEWLTGPVPLTKLAEAYTSTQQYQLTILPPEIIFPYSWDTATPYQHCVCSAQAPTLDTEQCKALFPHAYALTFWSHSWSDAHMELLEDTVRRTVSV